MARFTLHPSHVIDRRIIVDHETNRRTYAEPFAMCDGILAVLTSDMIGEEIKQAFLDNCFELDLEAHPIENVKVAS